MGHGKQQYHKPKENIRGLCGKERLRQPLPLPDDGWNGASFDRPDCKRLIEDVEQGKIGTVIVKDMSRAGRDYLKVGVYTKVLFQKKGVHFIAISNGVDSEKRESAEFAPFLNIMNE